MFFAFIFVDKTIKGTKVPSLEDVICTSEINSSRSHVRIQRRGGGTGDPDPLKNHYNIGFLNKTGADHL